MWPSILASWCTILLSLLKKGSYESLIFIGINTFGLLISVSLFLLFGDGTFSKLHLTGKYQVGFQKFHTMKSECAVSVFYPIELYTDVQRKHWITYLKDDASIKALDGSKYSL